MAEKFTEPSEGDVSRGPGLLAEEIALTTPALLTTVFRVGVRAYNRQIGWDDCTIIAAMVTRLLSFGFTMASLAEGNGRHEYYLNAENIRNIIKWTWANEVLIFITVALIKVSICLYIFRFKKTGWLRPFLYILMAGLALTNAGPVIILFAQCQPLHAYWNRSAGTCWDASIYNGFIYASVGYSIISDLICTALPVIILWNVKISRKLKFAICGLMTLGLIASACAGYRAALSVLNLGGDLTYALVSIDLAAFAEADVGIIAANLALGRMMWIFIQQRRGKIDKDVFRKTTPYELSDNTKKSQKSSKFSHKSGPQESVLTSVAMDTPSGPYHKDIDPNNVQIRKTTDLEVVNEPRTLGTFTGPPETFFMGASSTENGDNSRRL